MKIRNATKGKHMGTSHPDYEALKLKYGSKAALEMIESVTTPRKWEGPGSRAEIEDYEAGLR